MSFTNILKPAIIFIFSVFLFIDCADAQENYFVPAKQIPDSLTSISARLERKYLSEIRDLPSEYKQDFQTQYKERWEYAKEKFTKGEIFTDVVSQTYLDALINEIVKANPALQKSDFKCYFSRTHNPNAAYLCEGLIVLNMGLFTKLSNESEAAFVLCHEISHYVLNHSGNAIKKYISTINSPELQTQLRKINKLEYGKREEIERLLKGLTFTSRKHSRDHETEADSMAIEFMKNTRFNLSESINALAKLDSIDREPLNTTEVIQQLFNSAEYPFQKKWIKKEEGLLGGHAIIEAGEFADSLKTHPECKARINILKPLVSKYDVAGKSKNPVNEIKFNELKNNFAYEIIEYAYASENYTCSLFYTLQLLTQKPADPYLITQTGKILTSFYTAQRQHRIGKVWELPSPAYMPNYNLLLQFIQNLQVENYVSIAYHFMAKHRDKLITYPAFKETFTATSAIFNQL